MLTKKQIKEIKEHLEKAQNPLFFFDNDEDGLCSFLLLQRYCGKGKGVPIKTFPALKEDYFRKVTELNADYIFILDKPVVSEEFFKEADKHNIPIVWIDHHPNEAKIPKFVNYYNPLLNKKKTSEPVTALCYQISQRKQDKWLVVVGCIGDKFLADCYDDFKKEYPELAVDSNEPWEIYYNSQIGKIARILSFALKDRITNVISMLKYLMKAKTPYDVLDENNKNQLMHKRFQELEKKYLKLISEAKINSEDFKKLLIFQYSGNMSMSSDLSDKLMYLFPKRIIFVMRIKENEVKVSGRGANVRDIFLKAIEGLENSRGGGHVTAIGGQFDVKDLDKFKENLIRLVEK